MVGWADLHFRRTLPTWHVRRGQRPMGGRCPQSLERVADRIAAPGVEPGSRAYEARVETVLLRRSETFLTPILPFRTLTTPLNLRARRNILRTPGANARQLRVWSVTQASSRRAAIHRAVDG